MSPKNNWLHGDICAALLTALRAFASANRLGAVWDSSTGFWMENTPLPLDIIYVSPSGRVLNVRRGQPYSREVLNSAGVTADVIELVAGEAERIGLKPGDRVRR